jgi:HK97 gp10 family phage protein
MSNYEIKLEGTEELLGNLQKIDSSIRSEVAVKAAVAGAEQISGRAKDNAPVLTGALRNSAIVEGRNQDGQSVAEIIFGRGLSYAKIQEFGGTITAKNSPFLVFRYKGQWMRKKSVTINGKHYLGNAIEQEKGSAVDAMSDVVRRFLEK